MTFKNRLERVMKAKGLTPRALAALCPELSLAWIYKVLRGGIANVGIDKVNILAAALGIEQSALMHSDFAGKIQKIQKDFDKTVEERIEDEGYIKPDEDLLEFLESWDSLDDTYKEVLKTTARQLSLASSNPQKKRTRKSG